MSTIGTVPEGLGLDPNDPYAVLRYYNMSSQGWSLNEVRRSFPGNEAKARFVHRNLQMGNVPPLDPEQMSLILLPMDIQMLEVREEEMNPRSLARFKTVVRDMEKKAGFTFLCWSGGEKGGLREPRAEGTGAFMLHETGQYIASMTHHVHRTGKRKGLEEVSALISGKLMSGVGITIRNNSTYLDAPPGYFVYHDLRFPPHEMLPVLQKRLQVWLDGGDSLMQIADYDTMRRVIYQATRDDVADRVPRGVYIPATPEEMEAERERLKRKYPVRATSTGLISVDD